MKRCKRCGIERPNEAFRPGRATCVYCCEEDDTRRQAKYRSRKAMERQARVAKDLIAEPSARADATDAAGARQCPRCERWLPPGAYGARPDGTPTLYCRRCGRELEAVVDLADRSKS